MKRNYKNKLKESERTKLEKKYIEQCNGKKSHSNRESANFTLSTLGCMVFPSLRVHTHTYFAFVLIFIARLFQICASTNNLCISCVCAIPSWIIWIVATNRDKLRSTMQCVFILLFCLLSVFSQSFLILFFFFFLFVCLLFVLFARYCFYGFNCIYTYIYTSVCIYFYIYLYYIRLVAYSLAELRHHSG